MESSMKCVKTTVEEEREEISIYLRVTKTVKLNVKESDSIGNVKVLLHDKEGIPVCHQLLFSEDNRLVDGRKLVDYGICKNSTLQAYVEDTVPMITLCVKRSYPEDIIIVYPKIYDTIQDVKSRIAAKEGTNSGKLLLLMSESFLKMTKPCLFSILMMDQSFVWRFQVLQKKMEPSMKRTRIAVEEEKEDEMTIYLKVIKTVSIKVKESDTVGDVKALLHDKEGIPECLQQLFSKDVRLTDEQKLVDYGIIKNPTLHAHIGNSVPIIFLVKRPYAKGAITVHSIISDTIQDVKCRIGAKEGVKSTAFSLIHDGRFLEDDETLAFYKIDGGSMLHMVFNPRDKLLISVVMPTKEIVQIEVKAALTVRDTKTIIETRVGCSIDSMDLFLGNQKLEDLKTLYQCDIKEESVLQVKHRTIQIFIKKSGRSITLDVHRHELVKNVKLMLLKKLKVPIHLQKLVFEGNFLADSRDLASYNIRMHSNVNFDVRSYAPTGYNHPEETII